VKLNSDIGMSRSHWAKCRWPHMNYMFKGTGRRLFLGVDAMPDGPRIA